MHTHLIALAMLWTLPAWGQPTIDFSQGPLGLLDGPHLCAGDLHVSGLYWDGARWRSHGEGARLYRFNRIDYRPNGTMRTMYHGLGFCAPADQLPGRTCGQVDQIHQEEILRVVPRVGVRITAFWLSEVVGNDAVDVWASAGLTFDATAVWITRAVAGEGTFNAGMPCAGVPTESVRPCDAIEGVVQIPVEHQQWRAYFLRGVPGARRGFVVWGVDVQDNDW